MHTLKWFLIYLLTILLFLLIGYLSIVPVRKPLKSDLNEFNSTSQIDLDIYKLAQCESSLNPNAVHYNDGGIGKTSRGILQFQKPTFIAYWRKLVNENIENAEFDNLWVHQDDQILLAKKMIENDRGALVNWKNCAKKLKLL